MQKNIFLRGHRDDGRLVVTKSNDFKNNEGNFQEILCFQAHSDVYLKIFLKSEGTIKYTNKISRNFTIKYCNSVLLDKIVAFVNDAKYFSILADETADIEIVRQISLFIKFVDLNKLVFFENFLQFVLAHDTTGKGLANLILESLKKLSIEFKFLHE